MVRVLRYTRPTRTEASGRAWPSTLRLSRKALPLQSVPFRGPFLGVLVAAHRRILAPHGLLAWKPDKAFLFVDDLLCALFRDSAPDMFALVVLFFCAIAAPISWKKAQFQDSLVWCGWETNFSHDTIQLVSAKLSKLDALIKALLGNRVPRKTLEQCIGLLIWATSIALHLRSWLAPLYSDLNSPPGSMHSIPPQIWSAFRASLNKDLRTSHSLPGHPGSFRSHLPGTSKPTWVRVADPNNPYTSLSKSSQQCLTWLASCFRRSPVPHQLQALAAADACAEDDLVGIGGWAVTSSQVVWFAETWNMQDIRAVWPCLVKPGQRYIACFERWHSWRCCKQPTAALVVGTTRSACLQARTIPRRKPALTSCSRPPGRCNSSCN